VRRHTDTIKPGREPSRPAALFRLGLGCERTLTCVNGLSNVREAIHVPRTPGHSRY
jgi:aspartyl/asparaginyl-tRNA synthetase